mgnify:FL=1
MKVFCDMLIITPNGSIITTPDPLIVRRFKLLYIFAQQIKSDHLLDQLEILAEQIKVGHPQVAEALDYYEDSIIQIFQ